MPELRTKFVPNLDWLDDETLEEITADGHTFAGLGWYRMLDRLDPRKLIGGEVELEYAVVTSGGEPVSVCPVLRARGDGLYFVYAIRRFYFEHWLDEAVRMNPTQADRFAQLMRVVSAYRSLLEWTGSRLSDAMLVTGPLSYRCHVPAAPSSSTSRPEIYSALIDALKTRARKRNLPLWFLGVEGSTSRLSQALEKSGFASSFLFYDNRVDLEQFHEFGDYLRSFRRTTRRAFLRDIRKTTEAGLELRFLGDFREHSARFAELYDETYAKYGESRFRHPPEFWTVLRERMGDSAEALVAMRDERVVGFNLLLENERRGELWTYRMGRSTATAEASAPCHFGLCYYGPIQRAIERGYRRVWLGPASYEAKSVRGAEQVPLYNHFWFPRRVDRWLLMPYLRLFGQVSRDEIARSVQRPLRVAEPVPADGTKRFKDAR